MSQAVPPPYGGRLWYPRPPPLPAASPDPYTSSPRATRLLLGGRLTHPRPAPLLAAPPDSCVPGSQVTNLWRGHRLPVSEPVPHFLLHQGPRLLRCQAVSPLPGGHLPSPRPP